VIGMNVDLVEMRHAVREHLDDREADGNVLFKRNPEATLRLRCVKGVRMRALGEDRLGRMTNEQPRGGKLDRCKATDIRRSCELDRKHAQSRADCPQPSTERRSFLEVRQVV